MLDFYYNPHNVSIFNFTTFVTALALLVIVYTIVDVRYQFRIAVSPLPLFKITFFFIILIGFGTLITDVWFAEVWSIPLIISDQIVWQGIFGFIFLSMVILWSYFAFIQPPIFGKSNYKRFVTTLLKIIVKGSSSELNIIADELGRSASSIIKFTNTNQHRVNQNHIKKSQLGINECAYDLLLLIGNRKLCRHIINTSPGTAIEIFRAIDSFKKYDIPIGQFSKNIATEALINDDSILYHEDNGYHAGLIGYLKPFTQSLYGNYSLIESLPKFGTPVDIDNKLIASWNAKQLNAYCRCILTTLESYLQRNFWPKQSDILNRALNNIVKGTHDLYKLDAVSNIDENLTITQRLQTTTNFIIEAIALFERYNIGCELKVQSQENLYDQLADMMANIIYSASYIRSPEETNWNIQYANVWYIFFIAFHQDSAWKIIRYKLCRILYKEIKEIDSHPNFKSAQILGFCLNVMGLELHSNNENRYYGYHGLHRALISWVSNNYDRLHKTHKSVADACLTGNITFDEKSSMLIKTYSKGLKSKPDRQMLVINKSKK